MPSIPQLFSLAAPTLPPCTLADRRPLTLPASPRLIFIFRCLRSLRKFLKKMKLGGAAADGADDEDDGDGDDKDVGDGDAGEGIKGEEDFCAWCTEFEDNTLFLCDGGACGR